VRSAGTPHVAIVGGGWAGCAAALTLAEAGVRVCLHEAGRTLGGRARAVELNGRTLDNGQHILLGAYTQTLHLIERLHPAPGSGLWRLPLSLRQPPDFALDCPRLPAPTHLLAGLLGARGIGWHDKLAAALWVRARLRDPDRDDLLSVSQLTRDQPATLNRLLWHPLCVSALNTPPETASARIFGNVLRAAFGARAGHSDLLLPRRDLTALFPAPAARRIADCGGSVLLASRILALDLQSGGVTLHARDAQTAYSHVILAVAPQHLAGLAGNVAELGATLRDLSGYHYQPIATGYLQYASTFRLAQPMFALADGPAQFVFDRGQSHGQSGLLAVVASAASDLPADWLDHAEAQLRRIVHPGAPVWRQAIVEKQATYACTPGMPRPSVLTAHPRLFLAGDYIDGLYPATLESATLSGVQSARALLEQL
jgi:squalene-associated FAD-dependent desaturase